MLQKIKILGYKLMSMSKKKIYMIFCVTIFGLVACSENITTTPDENLSITGDNLVGTWTTTLLSGITSTVVISSSSNVDNGNSVTFSLPNDNSTISLPNAGVYYRLTNTSVTSPPRVDIESEAGALADTLGGFSYLEWIFILQGDLNTARKLFDTFATLMSNSYMVYSVIPVSITKKASTDEIRMRAYTSFDLLVHATNDTDARSNSIESVARFITNSSANNSILTYTKQ